MRILHSLGIGRRSEKDTCLEAKVDRSVSGMFRLLQGAYLSNAPRGGRGGSGCILFVCTLGGLWVHTFRMYPVGAGEGVRGASGCIFFVCPLRERGSGCMLFVCILGGRGAEAQASGCMRFVFATRDANRTEIRVVILLLQFFEL